MEITAEEEKRYEELCNIAFNFARNDEWEDLQEMIKHGLPINLKNHKGNTLLMLAAYNGSFNSAKMLLEHGADVDERNDRGQTPLAGVCFKGDLPMVKLLVENGADIDANNGLGLTPYSFAVMFKRSDIAQYLLEKTKNKTFLKRITAKILSFFN